MPNQKSFHCKPIEVLMIEDDPVDVELMLEILNESKLFMSINVVGDGVEGLEYLRRQSNYSSAVRPDLILLDLNLPKKDGRQVLEELKKDDDLANLPVVVLTTSTSEEDMLRTQDLGAHGYITKPANLDQFIKIVQTIDDFWFTIVKFLDTEGIVNEKTS